MDYKNINDYEQIYLIKDNDEEARTMMFKKYKPIVLSLAKKYYYKYINFKIDIEDLIQEGYIGLYNSIRTFSESANACFYTYSTLCINRQIMTFCRSYTAKKNQLLNHARCIDMMSGYKNKKENTYYEQIISADFSDNQLNDYAYNQMCIQFKHSLPFYESLIFELRYNGFKYKEIAKLLDITVNSVDRSISNIKKKYQKMTNK